MKKINFIIALIMSFVAFAGTAHADVNVTVVKDINRAINEKWVITFRVNGMYLYGSDFQNCMMGDAAKAISSSNAVVGYKIEREGDNFLFRCVTPRGTDYMAWHWTTPFYLNSTNKELSISFNLALNGQKGMDMRNGAVWSLQPDGSIRNVGSGLYLGGVKMYTSPVKCEIVRIVNSASSSVLNSNDTEVELIHELAMAGNTNAQCTLGMYYFLGQGVTENATEAVKWWRKAADKGNTEAQTLLGSCYQKGKGVTKNAAEAVRWFRKAADQGGAEAQCQLGSCYEAGEGVAKNLPLAVKWYRKAAEQGHAEGQYRLGMCYYLGQGLTRNEAEGVKWVRKAAAQGHKMASISLKLIEL